MTWFLIGVTVGGALGTTLGVLVMALCIGAAREQTEDWVERVDHQAEAWRRGERR